MPKPKATGKRRIPTSSAMFPDEIELLQEAARIKRKSMSDFIRDAVVPAARRVVERESKPAA